MSCRHASAQTASTGALIVVTFDPSGSVVPGVTLRLLDSASGNSQSAISDREGRFSFLLLRPGTYELQASKVSFAPLKTEIIITVTETQRVEIHLQLATVLQQTQVSSEHQMLQSENPALGRVVNEKMLTGLPLVTRNLAQIAGLSPGVTAGVFNAGELGLGGIAISQIATSNDGIFVHGARSYENNWELDGISVSDIQGSGAGSGGIPVPNPDGLQEFKVQTALYDAAYGRYGGANVSAITKSGTNSYHGTMFEFLRNDVLNANDFFLKRVGRPRATLKQNQFGFSVGGPIQKDKLFFFGSYQGTRQVNGVAAGQSRIACTSSLSSPPLTDDRLPTALGQLFGGMTGALGGVAVKSDGSNINPAALALLNFKLPDGSFLIPTPQTVDISRPFANQGTSVFTEPCNFDENQFLANADFLASQKNRVAARFFFATAYKTVTFPGNVFNPVPNIPGFTSPVHTGNRFLSLADTYTFSNTLLNDLRFGYVRTTAHTESLAPFKWSDVGVSEGDMSLANELPNLNIVGSVAFSSAFPFGFVQNNFVSSDSLSFIHGAHTLRFGGSLTRVQDNFNDPGLGSFVQFLSWPDFLLGLSGDDNGTGAFSNVFSSVDEFGLFDREFRVWEGSLFSQDDIRIGKRLNVEVGLRYEWLGQFGDKLGRNSSFDISRADRNPPVEGSVAGYVVASNFPGLPPPGVLRANNTFANQGDGQGTIAPRLGFAWQVLPQSSGLFVRGGYGMYFSRPTGQAFYQSASASPFALLRSAVGATNSEATFGSPFASPFPTASTFPVFPQYSPDSAVSIYTTPLDFRSSIIQQFSLSVQSELDRELLLEVGYVGTRGTHLQRVRSLNQALDASPSNPIRGETSNTFSNINSRVPIPGIPADSLAMVESEGGSWYNGLEVSLTKRMSHGLQFLGSYTFSKALDTDGANINGTSAGIALTLGDQNSPSQRWGRASFDRTHRFIFSETWTLPSPTTGLYRVLLGGWELASVITVQSGNALTIADTNSKNVFGITGDRAQLTGNCTRDELVRAGSITSKLNNYFNTSCFTTPPVIGADGNGTGFGNSATGIVDGPGQANLDFALSKSVRLNWPSDGSRFQFRVEFYNALNHPQFANPDTNLSSSTFGLISSTSVSPRIGQLAVKFSF